ncbi:MAG TPA: rhodanese-like domain-containing protein [Thermoanaerobaculia bacterium]|jgi:rhodanese-related sulfurtransferase
MRASEPGPLSGLGVSAVIGTLVVLSASCATSRRVVASLTANCREVEAGVANEMMRDNPDVLLLDVRESRDFVADLPHFRKAREIPLPDLPRRYRELLAWKKEPILVFSRDGVDAASACEFLARQGFPYVSHVFGGIEAWMQAGYGRATASQ